MEAAFVSGSDQTHGVWALRGNRASTGIATRSASHNSACLSRGNGVLDGRTSGDDVDALRPQRFQHGLQFCFSHGEIPVHQRVVVGSGKRSPGLHPHLLVPIAAAGHLGWPSNGEATIMRVTAYLSNGGTIEKAQAIAAQESPLTTKLYDHRCSLVSSLKQGIGCLSNRPVSLCRELFSQAHPHPILAPTEKFHLCQFPKPTSIWYCPDQCTVILKKQQIRSNLFEQCPMDELLHSTFPVVTSRHLNSPRIQSDKTARCDLKMKPI